MIDPGYPKHVKTVVVVSPSGRKFLVSESEALTLQAVFGWGRG